MRIGRRGLFVAAAVSVAGPLDQASGSVTDKRLVDARLGVYKGAGCEGRAALAGFVDWLGRRPGWVIDFLPSESWADTIRSAEWLIGCWRGAPFELTLAVPLLSSERRQSLSAGAGGAYDAHFLALGRLLVAAGRSNTVLRLGWEFNGDWVAWNAAKDPAAFVAYWRRVVRVMRSVSGARFRFDWNPTLGRAAIAADSAYPGDDAVDLIGLDVYNQSWTVPTSDQAGRWHELRHQAFGLDWHLGFARQHGKPRSFPEWGTGRRPDGSGGGDDPLFMREMASWVTAPDVAYYGYWDYPAADYNALLSRGQFPEAAKVFLRHFGAAAPRS